MTDDWLAGVRARMEIQRKLRPHRWSIWAADYERLVECAEALRELVTLEDRCAPLVSWTAEQASAAVSDYRGGEGATMNDALRFDHLREQNVSRKVRWHGEADEWSGADWSNAMAGECGEACNIVKKLRRHETRTGTAYNTPPPADLLAALAEELADVVTYADLLADKYGIDLGRAVRAKFNRVSAAQGFPERL